MEQGRGQEYLVNWKVLPPSVEAFGGVDPQNSAELQPRGFFQFFAIKTADDY